ncbi:MAG TPA: restriction endonuclease [bacterium]|nr:restriction endonuclease [bacterium]
MMGVLIVAFLAVGVGFGLIFLLAFADKQSRKRNAGKRPEPDLAKPQFEKACVEIIERMKLEIHDIQRTDDDNLDIRAKNPAPVVGGEFFIRCVYLPDGGRIEAAEIIEMSNVIVQDRLSKGIFMTNGRFTEDLPAIGELAPIEFIDGARLKAISADLPMV